MEVEARHERAERHDAHVVQQLHADKAHLTELVSKLENAVLSAAAPGDAQSSDADASEQSTRAANASVLSAVSDVAAPSPGRRSVSSHDVREWRSRALAAEGALDGLREEFQLLKQELQESVAAHEGERTAHQDALKAVQGQLRDTKIVVDRLNAQIAADAEEHVRAVQAVKSKADTFVAGLQAAAAKQLSSQLEKEQGVQLTLKQELHEAQLHATEVTKERNACQAQLSALQADLTSLHHRLQRATERHEMTVTRLHASEEARMRAEAAVIKAGQAVVEWQDASPSPTPPRRASATTTTTTTVLAAAVKSSGSP